MPTERILEDLQRIALLVQKEFKEERRLLSFREYLTLFATDPIRHSRDSSRYLRDMFDHFGRETVARPWGELSRFRLFDLPFLDQSEARSDALVHRHQGSHRATAARAWREASVAPASQRHDVGMASRASSGAMR